MLASTTKDALLPVVPRVSRTTFRLLPEYFAALPARYLFNQLPFLRACTAGWGEFVCHFKQHDQRRRGHWTLETTSATTPRQISTCYAPPASIHPINRSAGITTSSTTVH